MSSETKAETSSGSNKINGKAKGNLNSYLLLYNAASWAGWTYVLTVSVLELFKNGGDVTKLYDRIGWTLTLVQTAAILEIFHVLLGLVRSPFITTVIQVSSRLTLVWLIVNKFPEVRSHWAFTSMTIAWSITECIRYAFYGLNLIGNQPGWLLWCRYTFFFILYPVGAGSESILVFESLRFAIRISQSFYWILVILLLIYVPGFYTMYNHMIGQRRKILGKGKVKNNQ
ncbi:PTPLA-domain-containing protein [Rhizophagus irregularis]|uniref:Very-long-chain (3R)-3-hydroxyacyl-CoA dehydratase n=1 Tax=Rhizophagus irregularis TaxID=588596 RepID=A0A2N0QAQ5_9GLOM|nr:PTPLA-domain-containing protein [Rhizophagus irregularis]